MGWFVIDMEKDYSLRAVLAPYNANNREWIYALIFGGGRTRFFPSLIRSAIR